MQTPQVKEVVIKGPLSQKISDPIIKDFAPKIQIASEHKDSQDQVSKQGVNKIQLQSMTHDTFSDDFWEDSISYMTQVTIVDPKKKKYQETSFTGSSSGDSLQSFDLNAEFESIEGLHHISEPGFSPQHSDNISEIS